MREILFDGKRKDGGEWIEGYYCPCCFGLFPCRPAIIPKQEMDAGCWRPVEIIPETLGQFTGRTDNKGIKIFEHDIVKYQNDLFEVFYYEPQMAFYLHGYKNGRGGVNGFTMTQPNTLEVVGNIFDYKEDT